MPGRRVVGPRVRGYPDWLLLVVGDVGLHQPDVGVVISVGLLCTVAGESDEASIRRPGRIVIIVVARSNLEDDLRLHIKDIKMGAQTIQITRIVLFEM
ncbi:MAG: hypothetical protein B5M54_05640 [Candidatus Aminicenantes bacterium 4484_214]|nr:MAG: hypothetical protein B5M54_05640 [Candidatus Aminicenantes bacterium 4484_214]